MARTERRVRPPGWLARLVQAHAQVFFFSLGRLYRNPVGTLLTASVIGITLALPAGLHVLLKNIGAISYSWEGALQASLFLADQVDGAAGERLARQLAARPDVESARFISREQSLAEFKALSGFGEALDLLEENPLPAVIALVPRRDLGPEAIERLIAELEQLPEVEFAKLDQKWLQRLYGILEIIERGVRLVALVLALAVVVTVGNTIRLDIQARREEIVVMKLVGAPDAFIRRPFLYTGFWYGVTGALIAWLLVSGALLALAGPTARLSGLYGSDFSLLGLSAGETLLMFAAGIALGLGGAFWTVTRHLRAIEPS